MRLAPSREIANQRLGNPGTLHRRGSDRNQRGTSHEVLDYIGHGADATDTKNRQTYGACNFMSRQHADRQECRPAHASGPESEHWLPRFDVDYQARNGIDDANPVRAGLGGSLGRAPDVREGWRELHKNRLAS